MTLHYLNQDYQPGLVFQQLLNIKYNMVIGIDVGHGECMAFVYRKDNNGTWIPEPLAVTQKGEHHIPSYIAYVTKENGKKEAIIGNDASLVSDGFYVYFKQEPAKWGESPEGGAPTYGQLLKDYISVLWKNIWTYNDVFHNAVNPVKKEDLLVVIGCPASGSWTEPKAMRKYVDLTKAVTGCSKVVILAESTAAIMTPIYSKTAVDLGNGVAIYDFGSSTLDFTYILIGKVLLTASIPLGGSDVDQAMLRYVLKENGTNPEQIERKSLNSSCTQLRSLKETYYNTNESSLVERKLEISRKLNYWLDDMVLRAVLIKMEISCEGETLEQVLVDVKESELNRVMLDLILQTHGMMNVPLSKKERERIYLALTEARNDYLASGMGKQYSISVGETIPYTVNKQMMYSVIEEDKTVSMNKLDASYKDKSWKACVEQFFDITKNSIGTAPCGTVILTGGTSKITDVHKIAREKYGPDVIIHKEEDPSSTVAKGLCLAKGHEVSASENIELLKKDLHDKMKGYFQAFSDGFGRGKLFDCIWAKLILSIKEVQCEMQDMEKRGSAGITTYRELKDVLEKKLSDDVIFQNEVKVKFTDYVKNYMDPAQWEDPKKTHCIELVRKTVNQLATEVYQAEATTVPQVSDGMVGSLAGKIDEEILLAVVKETSLVRAVQKIVVDHMCTGVKRFVKKISLKFDKNISLEDVTKMCETMQVADREAYRRDLGFQFSWALQHSNAFKGIFESLIDQQFEVAVGIILFQVFDH